MFKKRQIKKCLGNIAGVAAKTFDFPPELNSKYGQDGLIWRHRFQGASITNLSKRKQEERRGTLSHRFSTKTEISA